LPKNQENLIVHVNDSLKKCIQSINDDYKQLINKQTSFETFLLTVDSKFLNSQNTITQYITNFEQRFDTRFNDVKTIISTNENNLSNLLQKMNRTVTMGNISENVVYNILNGLYPSANIEYVGDINHNADILFERINKPKILIENKDYSTNVPTPQVEKFIKDIDKHNCSGIMFSQHSGISNKNNFEINIHKGNVLVYVHYVNFDREIINVAINVLDNIKYQYDQLSDENDTDNGHYIDNELLDKINDEVNEFTIFKNNITKTIKTLLNQINKFEFPNLSNYLSDKYGTTKSNNYACDECGVVKRNLQCLSQHKRQNHPKQSDNLSDNLSENSSQVSSPKSNKKRGRPKKNNKTNSIILDI